MFLAAAKGTDCRTCYAPACVAPAKNVSVLGLRFNFAFLTFEVPCARCTQVFLQSPDHTLMNLQLLEAEKHALTVRSARTFLSFSIDEH